MKLRVFRSKAQLIRRAMGSDLEKTMLKAVRTLATGGIPCLVAGGYAVQENGYARFTSDVDLIVPNVKEAFEYLAIRGFKPNSGSLMSLTDRETKFEVDLLPAGGKVGPGPLVLPQIDFSPSQEPHILSLEQLIAAKLSSWMGSKIGRAKDFADVVELIKANQLGKDFATFLPPEVQEEYSRIQQELEEEKM